jgi:hypothetical protein
VLCGPPLEMMWTAKLLTWLSLLLTWQCATRRNCRIYHVLITSWLTSRLTFQRHACEHVDDDVLQFAQPPERYAISHRKMYAFGMHFRVRSAERGLVTRDSCVVASFTRQVPWGLRNGEPIETTEDRSMWVTLKRF